MEINLEWKTGKGWRFAGVEILGICPKDWCTAWRHGACRQAPMQG